MGLPLRYVVEIADSTESTHARHLSRYLDVAVEGHAVVLRRVPSRPDLVLYELRVDDELQPDIDVTWKESDDEALVSRAFAEWRARNPRRP